MTCPLLRRLILPIALTAAVLAQPCVAAPGSPGGCTVLMGGFGTMTADSDTNGRWLGLSSDLAHAVSGKLTKAGYHMSDFVVYLPDAQLRAKALEDTVYKTGCHKILQVSFDLANGASHPKDAPDSGFVVALSRLEQTVSADGKSRTLKIIEEYNVEYEFIPSRPKPTLDALAQSVADDLVKSGQLDK